MGEARWVERVCIGSGLCCARDGCEYAWVPSTSKGCPVAVLFHQLAITMLSPKHFLYSHHVALGEI